MNKEKDFSQGEWDHLHDVILDVTYSTSKLSLTQKELEGLFDELPQNIKDDSYRWGLNDSVVRDNIYEWYLETKLKQTKDEV